MNIDLTVLLQLRAVLNAAIAAGDDYAQFRQRLAAACPMLKGAHAAH